MENVFENSWHVALADPNNASHMHHYYTCVCGNTKQISLYSNHANFPYIKCSQCSNTYYLDLDIFQNRDVVRYWKSFHWSYELIEDEEGWHIFYYYWTPIIENTLTEISHKKNGIKKISLLKSGQFQMNSLRKKLLKSHLYSVNNIEIGKIIDREYEARLISFLSQSNSDPIAWIDKKMISHLEEKEKLNFFAFFLKNPQLRDKIFFRWSFSGCETLMIEMKSEAQALKYIGDNQTKRSVVRAVHSSYQADKKIAYNPLYDAVVCRIFEDENFIVRLLQKNVNDKNRLFKGFSFEDLLSVFGFLQRYYTQKECFTLMILALENSRSMMFFHDILQMLKNEEYLLIYLEHFERIRANLRMLHDDLARINRLYIANVRHLGMKDVYKMFEYDKSIKKAEKYQEDLEFRLPAHPQELFLWANELHNCMASFAKMIQEKQTVIFGVFKEDKICYAIEIKNQRIHQALGKYNRVIEKDDRMIIEQWIKGCQCKQM